MKNIFQTEPVLVIAALGVVAEALLLVLIAFGVPIDPAQKLALEGLGTAIITGLSAVFARAQVTPTASLPPAPVVPATVLVP